MRRSALAGTFVAAVVLLVGFGWVAAGSPASAFHPMASGPENAMHGAMHGHMASMHGGAACEDCREPSSGKIARVVMQETAYEPATLTIRVGEEVEWVNADPYGHTVTSDEGLFDSGNVPDGRAWAYTFSEPGTYAYHCTPHSWRGEDGAREGMVGTIVVVEP